MTLDFATLAAHLLPQSLSHLERWLPGGKLRGREYLIGDLRGSPGESLSVNVDTGEWADFASGDRGRDLISLYAQIRGVANGEAARILQDDLGLQSVPPAPRAPPKPTARLGAPPAGTKPPAGQFDALYEYHDAAGGLLMAVARVNARGEERKRFIQFAWDLDLGKWAAKAFPDPRPLYGLDLLAKRPDASVLVVEGEKACHAARSLIGMHYVVVTWPGGSAAWAKADWAPLKGRKVLLWPDADVPGVNCMGAMARKLAGEWSSTRIVDTTGQPEGWDAADAAVEGWDTAKLIAWAKPRAKDYVLAPVVAPAIAAPVEPPAPPVVITTPPVVVIPDAESTDPDPVSGAAMGRQLDLGLAVNSQGTPHANLDNMTRILRLWEPYRNICWWDTFHQKRFTRRGGSLREWNDQDDVIVTTEIQRDLGIARMAVDTVRQAIDAHARAHAKDEPRDWMETLTWDGVPRISRFAVTHLGTKEDEYTLAVSRNFWICMVARTYRPGAKVDTMLVLEGVQGAKKSTALNAIAGEAWFAEVNADIGTQRFSEQIQGKLLIEIAELDAMNRTDVTRIKQALSCRSDRFRPPYGRYAIDFPRRCVFTGSTNEEQYLRDPTGARRFWPLRCGTVNAEQIVADRTQLFAEAVAAFKAGETWYEVPGDRAAKEQEERRSADAWEDVVYRWLSDQRRMFDEVSIGDLLRDAIGLDLSRIERPQQQRMGAILKRLGWTQGWTAVDGRGRTGRIWRRPAA